MTTDSFDFTDSNQQVQVVSGNKSMTFSVIKPEIVQVFQDYGKSTHSYAVEGDKTIDTKYAVSKDGDVITIKTDALMVKVDPQLHVDVYDADNHPLVVHYNGQRESINQNIDAAHKKIVRSEGHEVAAIDEASDTYYEVLNQLDDDEQFYGLGGKTGFLNKRGYEYDNWNTDEPRPHIESFTHLYKSIPILFGIKQGHPYGLFFDNTYRSHFDLGKESSKYYVYSADDGNLNYYILGGATLKDVVADYTYLTGVVPLPQRWMLGYQQSRWGYSMDQSRVEEIVDKFEQYHLPLEAVHFDIDYMKGYRVFTWDTDKFADPKAFLMSLRKRGVRVIPILDPGVKQDDDYDIYQEGLKKGYFAKNKDGSVYINRVWPGKSAFPDFGNPDVRKWWGKHCKFLLDNGAAGIWTDMNEPATFDGDMPDDVVMTDEDQPSTAKMMHNVYGHNMAKATYNGIKDATGKRPYVITRAAYAGTQKYSTVWTGDNQSLWHHLQMSIPQLCNLGMSGFSYAGTDIGGFSADTTPELLTRWVEAALFSPLFRNHSALQVRNQEPWVFGKQVLDIYRKFLHLRYRFIPYLYDCFHNETQDGLPVMRALVLNYPDDKTVRNMNDEYMVGDNVLVAPIVQQGQTARAVYLPKGQWIALDTGVEYTGETTILANVPIDKLPIFIKKNTLLPWGQEVEHISDQPDKTMTFRLFGDAATYTHYQDDGVDFNYQNGEYNEYAVSVDAAGNCQVKLNHHGYDGQYQTVKVQLNDRLVTFKYDDQSAAYVLAD